MNNKIVIKKYTSKGVSESALGRLISEVKSIRFIGDKPHSSTLKRTYLREKWCRLIRMSYWQPHAG